MILSTFLMFCHLIKAGFKETLIFGHFLKDCLESLAHRYSEIAVKAINIRPLAALDEPTIGTEELLGRQPRIAALD